jgi:hypothetical protein
MKMDEQKQKQPKKRIGPLDTMGRVVAELGRLYREARQSDGVSVADASRLATILGIMRQCLEASDIERRLTEMEAALAEPSNVVPIRRVV